LCPYYLITFDCDGEMKTSLVESVLLFMLLLASITQANGSR
jgi:hypothetical protein